jgi:hypothetical protein
MLSPEPPQIGGSGCRRAGTMRVVSEDEDLLPDRERARVKSRDRKVRGPKVIVDNAGLKKLALHIADKRRATKRKSAA